MIVIFPPNLISWPWFLPPNLISWPWFLLWFFCDVKVWKLIVTWPWRDFQPTFYMFPLFPCDYYTSWVQTLVQNKKKTYVLFAQITGRVKLCQKRLSSFLKWSAYFLWKPIKTYFLGLVIACVFPMWIDIWVEAFYRLCIWNTCVVNVKSWPRQLPDRQML